MIQGQRQLFSTAIDTKENFWREYVRLSRKPIQFSEETCITQHVYGESRFGKAIEFDFVSFLDKNKHIRIGHKCQNRHLIARGFTPESVKRLHNYSVYKCGAFRNPERTQSKKRMWEKRYEKDMARFFFFHNPKWTQCLFAQAHLSTNMEGVSGTLTCAYLPDVDEIIELSVDFGGLSSTSVGFLRVNKQRVLSRLKKACIHKSSNYDLFETRA